MTAAKRGSDGRRVARAIVAEAYTPRPRRPDGIPWTARVPAGQGICPRISSRLARGGVHVHVRLAVLEALHEAREVGRRVGRGDVVRRGEGLVDGRGQLALEGKNHRPGDPGLPGMDVRHRRRTRQARVVHRHGERGLVRREGHVPGPLRAGRRGGTDRNLVARRQTEVLDGRWELAAEGFSVADFSVAQPITTARTNRNGVRVIGMTPSRRTSRFRDCLPDTAGRKRCGPRAPTPLRPAVRTPSPVPDHRLLPEEPHLHECLEVEGKREARPGAEPVVMDVAPSVTPRRARTRRALRTPPPRRREARSRRAASRAPPRRGDPSP